MCIHLYDSYVCIHMIFICVRNLPKYREIDPQSSQIWGNSNFLKIDTIFLYSGKLIYNLPVFGKIQIYQIQHNLPIFGEIDVQSSKYEEIQIQ